MTLSGLLLAAAIVAVPAAPAAAQNDQPLPARAADAIAVNGYFQSPSAEVDGNALAAMASGHQGFGFVVLSDEPIDASIELADDVLDAAQSRAPLVHTVVVVSPADYGAVSERYSDEAIDAAFEDVVDTLRTDRVAGLDAFADRVPAAGPSLADERADDNDDGRSFPIGWVLLLVAVIGGSFLLKSLGLGSSGDGYSDGDGYDSGPSSRRSSCSSRRSFSSRRSSSSSASRRSSSSGRRGRGGGRF